MSGLCLITSDDSISSLFGEIYQKKATHIGLYYNETFVIYISLFIPFSQSLYWLGPTNIKFLNIVRKMPLDYLNHEINFFVEKQLKDAIDPYSELLNFLKLHGIKLINLFTNQEIVNQPSNQEVINQPSNQEITNQEITNQEINNQEITNQEINNQEINNQEINNQEINNQEINNQEINNQEINNQEIKNRSLTNQPLTEEIDDESSNETDLISIEETINRIESNIIHAFRRSLYNVLIGKKPYSDLIGSIFDPKHIKYQELIDKSLYAREYFDLEKYQELNQLHHDNINKSAFIKVDPNFDNYAHLLYHQVKKIRNKINDNLTPTLNFNDLVTAANYFSPDLQPIEKLDNSISIGLLINPSIDEKREINIKFKDNQKVIISAKNPNLDIFNSEQLKEILLSLDIYTADDPAFNDIKRLIIQKLIK